MTTFVSSSRWGLLRRSAFGFAPAGCLFAIVGAIWRDLDFTPSATSSLLVEYSYAVAVVPLALAAVWLSVGAVRHGLMAVWPGAVGVEVSDGELAVRRGPWGTRRYDAARLDLRYLFEMDEEEHGSSFEAFLPEDRQRATAVPPLRHPASAEALREALLRVLVLEEAEVAGLLRPAVDRWRALYRPDLDGDDEDDE